MVNSRCFVYRAEGSVRASHIFTLSCDLGKKIFQHLNILTSGGCTYWCQLEPPIIPVLVLFCCWLVIMKGTHFLMRSWMYPCWPVDRVQSPGLDLVLLTSVWCTHLQITCPFTQKDIHTLIYKDTNIHTDTMHLQAYTDTQSHTLTQ